MRLNPHHPEWYNAALGYAAYHSRQYNEAIAALRQVASRTMLDVPLYLALSYAQLGREAEGATAVADLLAIDPDFSAERHIENDVFRDQGIIDHFVDSASKAGVPLCATEAQLAKYPHIKRLEQCEAQRASG